MSTSGEAARSRALRLLLLLGAVSLLADMTYEGARSATGPFLLSLGAAAPAVALAAGLGEGVGYALRLAAGHLVDRWRRPWPLMFAGYALNLLAVPLLALAGNWPLAATLVVLERTGKAIRSPARDTVLSFAARRVGRGFGFGLHEALDQVGAVVGPLLVAAVLAAGGGYRWAFALLALPALLALVLLTAAPRLQPDPAAWEAAPPAPAADGRAPARAWRLYLGFAAAGAAGFAPFQLLSYHFKVRALLADPLIPLAFALAMAADAVAALAAGWRYDRRGAAVLLALPAGGALAALLGFGGAPAGAWAGTVLWGATLGMQEVARAAVADLTPPGARGRAFGVFSLAFGLAWFAGGAVMGWLYQRAPGAAAAFAAAAQALSLACLAALLRAGALRRSSSRC